MPTQRFDGPTLEAALEQARKATKGGARVVAAHKVRSGGVGGWFSKEHVEVEVELQDGAGARQCQPDSEQPAAAPAAPMGVIDDSMPRSGISIRPGAAAGGGDRSASARANERGAADVAAAVADRRRRPADGTEEDGPRSILDLAEAINSAESATRAATPQPAATTPKTKTPRFANSDKPWVKATPPAPTAAATGRPGPRRTRLESVAEPAVSEERGGGVAGDGAVNGPGGRDGSGRNRNHDGGGAGAGRRQHQPAADVDPESLEPSTESSAFSAVLRRIAAEAGLPLVENLDDDDVILDLDALTAEARGETPATGREHSRRGEEAQSGPETPGSQRRRDLAEEPGRSAGDEEIRIVGDSHGDAVAPAVVEPEIVEDHPALAGRAPVGEMATSQELMLNNGSLAVVPGLDEELFEYTLIGGRAAALARLGVPEDLLPAMVPNDLGPTWRDLRQILISALSGIPEPAPLPDGPGSVVAIIGAPRHAAAVARAVSRDLGLDPEEVVVATSRRLRRPNNPPLTSAQAVRDKRQSWQWRTEPTVVALECEVRPDTVRWARKMLVALDPTTAWGAVDACLKLDDIASWSLALGGLDALALVDLDGTTSPAAPLHLGLPIARIDGRPATPQAWADLLTERLTV